VEENTPKEIRNNELFDLDSKDAFEFRLTKKVIDKLELRDWFKNYKKEALISTAGIRGAQNILCPWDTRFPINQMGITLATLGKALVLKEKHKEIGKIAGSEVRYNSKKYMQIIARIQAAQGITTHIPENYNTIPVWMASYLIFVLDLKGGEYITSSHGVSTKTATKDLNDQGSQFMPEESIQFVNKIEQILDIAEKEGYSIKFSSANNQLITQEKMAEISDGTALYIDYLKKGVATKLNLSKIKSTKNKIIIDNVGGCTYKTQNKIFKALGISDSFEWLNIEEDPFFHGIGKVHTNPKTGADQYFDLSCDASILEVVQTMDYNKKLKNKPAGTVVEIVDPDGDRLVLAQVEPAERKAHLEKMGVSLIKLDEKRVLTVYTPNQSYLMIMDYHKKHLDELGTFSKHPRFIIKTTASAMSWDEWAKNNNIPVINVPVGFKEIASIMRKLEKQIIAHPDKQVIIKDIYGKQVNLGVQPRLLFAGEESGGMVTGPDELIKSNSGRLAISMREKSDGESLIIASAMIASLYNSGKYLSDYLLQIFEESEINGRYDIRVDNTLYDESNPDPISMLEEKRKGELFRDKNDIFFLGIAIARRENKLSKDEAKAILKQSFPDLDFTGFKDILFVGDGSFLEFEDKFVEIRKSGTDAKIKAYGAGADKEICKSFAAKMGFFDGALTPLYKKHISQNYLEGVPDKAKQIYTKFVNE
jgi:phosphomannomutase